MKNIHVLPTDKKSRLQKNKHNNLFLSEEPKLYSDCTNQNIYITNDEEIKEGDWVVEINTSLRTPYIGKTFYPKNDGTVTDEILKKHLLSVNYKDHYETIAHKGNCSKIILTTDQDLIKDGVQAIDDEFLEWFVKNPSCEVVETKVEFIQTPDNLKDGFYYKIIIPKEEPKQETLEEVAERLMSDCYGYKNYKGFYDFGFKKGFDFSQQQNKNLYSEEDLKEAYMEGGDCDSHNKTFYEWFEKFSKLKNG